MDTRKETLTLIKLSLQRVLLDIKYLMATASGKDANILYGQILYIQHLIQLLE